MLWIVALGLMVLWLIGFAIFNIGSLVHLLLVFALVVIVVRLVQGKKLA